MTPSQERHPRTAVADSALVLFEQGRSHPTLCYTSSLLLNRIPPATLTSPREPLLPLLLALSLQPSLPPYLTQLHTLLSSYGYPALAAAAKSTVDRSAEATSAREAELVRLEGEGIEGVRPVLERVWRRAADGADDELDTGRDVRSL